MTFSIIKWINPVWEGNIWKWHVPLENHCQHSLRVDSFFGVVYFNWYPLNRALFELILYICRSNVFLCTCIEADILIWGEVTISIVLISFSFFFYLGVGVTSISKHAHIFTFLTTRNIMVPFPLSVWVSDNMTTWRFISTIASQNATVFVCIFIPIAMLRISF